MSIWAAIIAFLKAFAAALDFSKWIAKDHRESSASSRLEEKNAAVDASIDGFGVSGSEAEQQSEANGKT